MLQRCDLEFVRHPLLKVQIIHLTCVFWQNLFYIYISFVKENTTYELNIYIYIYKFTYGKWRVKEIIISVWIQFNIEYILFGTNFVFIVATTHAFLFDIYNLQQCFSSGAPWCTIRCAAKILSMSYLDFKNNLMYR